MSTTPRVTLADPAEVSVSSVLLHRPEVHDVFRRAQAALWDLATDKRTTERIRIRNARITDCAYCRNVRFDGPRNAGLSEDDLDLIWDGYEESQLEARDVAALRVADAVIMDPGYPSEKIRTLIEQHLSTGETVECAMAAAFFMAMSKLLIVLGLEPEQMDTTVRATPTATR
jgi:alkylhydroperoxidase family enzyme